MLRGGMYLYLIYKSRALNLAFWKLELIAIQVSYKHLKGAGGEPVYILARSLRPNTIADF